jgi:hypothetical protein
MKGKAVLFGLNYAHCQNGHLNGCINDVRNMKSFLNSTFNIPIETYTDDTDQTNTSYDGILYILNKLASESQTHELDFVWIHYSGHGYSVKDKSGNEQDGMVPSDFEHSGIIIDDELYKTFSLFNPKTKIIFICDACHSGSILDLKYTWKSSSECAISNEYCDLKTNILLISGCRDDQTSSDTYDLLGDNKHAGALSACLLTTLKSKPEKIHNVFSLIKSVRKYLLKNGYKQIPCIKTSYDLSKNVSLFPLEVKCTQEIKHMKINNKNEKNNLPYKKSEQKRGHCVPMKISRRVSSVSTYFAPIIQTNIQSCNNYKSFLAKNNEYKTFAEYFF